MSLDLSPIADMASAAFLIVYAAVNAGHLRIRAKTGAGAVPVAAVLVAFIVMFVLLMVYIVGNEPAAAVALITTAIVAIAAEVLYRRHTRRCVKTLAEQGLERSAG